MKRTLEVTAIHYRRTVKRPTSRVLHGYCPVCGSPLEAAFVPPADPQTGNCKSEGETVFCVVPKALERRPEKDSGS